MNTPYTASTLHKVLAFGLAVSLLVWTFGVLLVIPAQAVDAHPNGTLVLSGSTVFKVMDGQRLGYPTANIFLSHGYDWDQIVPANSADLALPQGSNVAFADGTLVNDNGTIFMVSMGQKRGFTTASVFFGLGYAFSQALTGDLSAVPQGANIDSVTAAHPAGALVNANGTIWLVTPTGRMGIPSLAVFNSWGFDFAKVVPANAADTALATEANLGYRIGSVINDGGTVWAITSEAGKQGFPSASCFLDSGYQWSAVIVGSTAGYTAGANICITGDPGTPPPTSTGTLTVTLASDTPAPGIAIKSAARTPFTKVNLTATGGDVIIDSWVVARTGVAQDSSFASVDIIDLSTNATINNIAKTLNAQHLANFTEDFTIPNGTTKSVMLAGNIAASPGAGEQPVLALNSVTLKGGNVNGSFPISGNPMTINTTITIGTAAISRGTYTAATSTVEVGELTQSIFAFKVDPSGSTEDLTFSQIKLYQAGSASLASDLENIKLFRDGTFLANGVVDGNYVNFNFPAQVILKGASAAQYQVQADILNGSARTVQMGVWRTSDLFVKGNTYNAGITPTYTGDGSQTANPVLFGTTFTISQGTLRVGRSNTVGAENISIGSNQVLGAFEFEVKGESINVTQLTLTIASSAAATIEDALESVKVIDANGVTLAGPTDVTNNALTVVLTDSFTAPVGLNHYTVVGNLATNGGWATDDTITVSIATPATGITARGDVTGQTVTASPASNITASTQTVKGGGLTITENSTPTDQTVITNSNDVMIASWNFDASNSGEDIRITTITIKASTTGKLNALTLKLDGATLSPVKDNPTATNDDDVDLTFALSSPIVIAKGASHNLSLHANIGSNALAGEVDAWELDHGNTDSVAAIGVETGNNIVESITDNGDGGPAMTIAAAGSLAITLDASTPSSRLIVDGTSGVVLSEVRLKATNEAVNITQLKVNVVDGGLAGTAAGTQSQISKFFLMKDGAIIGTQAGYNLASAVTTINLGQGVLQVPEGSTGVKLSLTGNVVQIGTNQPGTPNADIKVGLYGGNSFTATGVGSNTAAAISYTDSTGSPVIIHKAVPSVANSDPGTSLSGSSNLHRTSISAVGGTIGIYRLSYQSATSADLILSNFLTKLTSCGTCGGIVDGSQLAVDAAPHFNDGGVTLWNLPVDSTQSHGKHHLQIPAGATAVIDLFGTVTGIVAGSNVSTSLLGDTATTTNDAGGSQATAFGVIGQGNFVWSDLNLDESTGASSLTSKQWYNGYLVSGLGGSVTSTPITVD